MLTEGKNGRGLGMRLSQTFSLKWLYSADGVDAADQEFTSIQANHRSFTISVATLMNLAI